MSFLATQPELPAAAGGDVPAVGEAMTALNAAAGVISVTADEVSALTPTQFAMRAQIYQHASAQSAAMHQVFATTLASSADLCAATEAANVVTAS